MLDGRPRPSPPTSNCTTWDHIVSVTYKDYYDLLGVERSADAKAIKKAYRMLAREPQPRTHKTTGAPRY